MSQHLILDTDIDTDCDDAGALAVLHSLIGAGECNLLGVVCSVPVPACAGAVRAINAWYGRAALPVGLVAVPDYASAPAWRAYRAHHDSFLQPASGRDPYNVVLAKTRPADDPEPENAVRLYRRLLAGAPDQSVTICAIGTLTALAQLLASPADELSPLAGRELVSCKVRELVSMAAAAFPAGREVFNWSMDLPSAAAVIGAWPTVLTVSPCGATVLTGARFVPAAPASHPVREAYVRHLLGGPDNNRSSWDLVAALYAVHGLAGPFALSADRTLTLDPLTADYRWQPAAASTPPRRLVQPLLSDSDLATMLEDLMMAPLK